MHTGIFSVARFPLALAFACLVASPQLSAIEIEQRSLSTTDAPVKPAPVVQQPAPVAAPKVVKAAAPAQVATNPAWDMFQQLEEMRGTIARLQGSVEEQQQLIERLQSDLRTRYTDLDQRLEQLAKPAAPEPLPAPPPAVIAEPAAPVSAPAPAPVASTDTPANATTPALELSPEELNRQKSAYLAAYQSFRRDGAAPAIVAMTRFLENYPGSVFAPNAYYWLGEFQLALEPANLSSAEANFQRVLRDYSASPKVASAYYKLGTIADLQGKRKLSRDWMTKLINQFPSSQEARLAQSFLDQNPAK